MKEKVKRIHGLKDLLDQFFCYTTESGCQFMFSRYMLNLEDWIELKGFGQIQGMFGQEIYLRKLEDLGCDVYHITIHKTPDAINLGKSIDTEGNHFGFFLDRVNEFLAKDFELEINIEGQMRAIRRLNLEQFYKREFPTFPPKEDPAVEDRPSIPWFWHSVALIVGSGVIIGLLWGSRIWVEWFQ